MNQNIAFEYINNPGFFVTGIAVKTTNQNGQARTDIGSLWTRFMTENLAGQIDEKLSEDIYCVYTDYESDHTGWYTAVLGCRVPDTGNIPDGLFTALVPPGDYHIYKPQGKFPDCVANTWMEIWQMPIDRRYTADYDLYKSGAKSFEETEVEVCIAVA